MSYPTSYHLGAVFARLLSGVLQAMGLLPRGIGGASPQVIYRSSGTTAHTCLPSLSTPHRIYKLITHLQTTTQIQKPKIDNSSAKTLVPNKLKLITSDQLSNLFPTKPKTNGGTKMKAINKKTDRAESGGSSHVRFTADEYRHIQNDSDVTGTSIPNLLKESYFVAPPLAPLMRQDDKEMVMSQLSRLNNNMNQIARRINSGFRSGFNDELSEALRMFTRLVSFITSTYDSRKNREER